MGFLKKEGDVPEKPIGAETVVLGAAAGKTDMLFPFFSPWTSPRQYSVSLLPPCSQMFLLYMLHARWLAIWLAIWLASWLASWLADRADQREPDRRRRCSGATAPKVGTNC